MPLRPSYGPPSVRVTSLVLMATLGCLGCERADASPGAHLLSDAGLDASASSPDAFSFSDAGLDPSPPDVDEMTRSDSLELTSPPPSLRLHLRCETATVIEGVRWWYRTNWFALDGDPVTLEVSRAGRVQGSLHLTPLGDGVWSSERASVTLETRIGRDGAILLAPRVMHTVPGAVVQARADNGFCVAQSPSCSSVQVGVCSGGPSGAPSCACLDSGIAHLDPIGQAVIGFFAGGPVRLFVRGVLWLLGSGAARLLGIATTAGLLSVLVSSSATADEHAALEVWIARELDTRTDATVSSLVALRDGDVRVLGASRPSLGELLAATRLRGSSLTLARDGSGRWGIVAGAPSAPWRSVVIATPRPSDPATLSESIVIVEEIDRRAGALLVARRDLHALME